MNGPLILNRAHETTQSTGTGTKTLDGAAPGKQTLKAAAITLSGDAAGPWLVELFIADDVDWELGEYTLTAGAPDTLTPVRIRESTNGNAAVDWGGGTRNVVSGPSAQSLGSVFGMAPETELTISAGSVTPRFAFHAIDTEGNAASDNLDTIALTYMRDTSILLIRPMDAARTVVVRHNQGTTGRILLNDSADFTMDDVSKCLQLKRNGDVWEELGRSYGSDVAAARAFLGFGTAAGEDIGTSGSVVPKLDGANSWSAAQTFTVNPTVTSTDAGAAAGPSFFLHRDSASPAANDILGAQVFDGEDSAGNRETYAQIEAAIADPTNGSEDGFLAFLTKVAGTLARRFRLGAGFYAEGLTDPGAGKINAQDYQKNGTALPNTSLYDSGNQTISSGGTLSLTHGLGATPKRVDAFLVCTSNDGTYTAGQVVPIAAWQQTSSAADNHGMSVTLDGTSIGVRFGANANVFRLIRTDNGADQNCDNTKWALVIRAYA